MEDIIRDNKPTIIILAGALLIIIIVLLLFIPLREEKIKSNKKYFPNYEDIVINEKVIKDKTKYEKVVKQLESDTTFNKLLMVDDYNSSSASKRDLENMLTNYILLYTIENTLPMKKYNKETGVFCLTEKRFLSSFNDLYNTDASDYFESIKYYFEHVFRKQDKYCIYYNNINKKYGKSIKSSIEKLSYDDGVITVNAYVYSYKDGNQTDKKTKEKNLESAIENKNYSLASSIAVDELGGEAKRKMIEFKIDNDGKYFKYQIIDIKTLE